MVSQAYARPSRPGTSSLLEEVIAFLEPQARSEALKDTPTKAYLYELRVNLLIQKTPESADAFFDAINEVTEVDPVAAAFNLHHAAHENTGKIQQAILAKFEGVLETIAKRNSIGSFSGDVIALTIAVLGAFEARGAGDKARFSVCWGQVEEYKQRIAMSGNLRTTVDILHSLARIFGNSRMREAAPKAAP